MTSSRPYFRSAMTTPRARSNLSRRTFLRWIGAGALATFLAGCSDGRSPTPFASPARPTPIASALPSTPAPTASTPTPGPSPTGPFGEPDLRAKIAQMLLVGFRGLTVKDATTTVADIADRGLGGVLLFDYDSPTGTYHRNVASPEQLRELVAGLRAAATIPLLVAIDEEGGKVDRLKARYGFPATVSEAELGANDDAAETRRRAKAIGETLAGLGIDLDLAPVVDLDVNPTNPVIGALDRSFSAHPAVVTRQGLAYLAGLHDAGVGGTLKHFPGHGSSTADTHLGWVDVTNTWTKTELVPFRDIIATADVDAVLVAHVFDADLDPTYPASLSGAVIEGMLRRDLGFDGVVITDDLQMGALREVYGYATAVERGIIAGADILTIANEQVYEPGIVATTIDIVEAAVAAGRIEPERIDDAWRRISTLKAGLGSA
jgi:beta-N-acetylhexosaminidase